MELKTILEKYGRVEETFYDGKVRGNINGYGLEIEETKYGYTVYIFLNDGIRKFFETTSQLESFLSSLA